MQAGETSRAVAQPVRIDARHGLSAPGACLAYRRTIGRRQTLPRGPAATAQRSSRSTAPAPTRDDRAPHRRDGARGARGRGHRWRAARHRAVHAALSPGGRGETVTAVHAGGIRAAPPWPAVTSLDAGRGGAPAPSRRAFGRRKSRAHAAAPGRDTPRIEPETWPQAAASAPGRGTRDLTPRHRTPTRGPRRDGPRSPPSMRRCTGPPATGAAAASRVTAFARRDGAASARFTGRGRRLGGGRIGCCRSCGCCR
jgi:hypothetical protein